MRIASTVLGAVTAGALLALAPAASAQQDLSIRVYPRIGLFNALQYRAVGNSSLPQGLREDEAAAWKPLDRDAYLGKLEGPLRKRFPFHEWEMLTTDPRQHGYRTRKVQLVNPFPTGARGINCVLEFRNPRGDMQAVSYGGAATDKIVSPDCRVDDVIVVASNEALAVTLSYVQAERQVVRFGQVPEDLLVVSIGDSYGSGEGNPDSPRQTNWCLNWRDLFMCRNRAQWMDERCHRSAYAATIRAGLDLIGDPRQRGAVTIVSLACSGASIDNGIVGKYRGALDLSEFREKNADIGLRRDGSRLELEDSLDSQLDSLKAFLDSQDPRSRKRTIDVLSISIGGNDVSFSAGLRDLLLKGLSKKPGLTLPQIEATLKQNMQGLRKVVPRMADTIRSTLRTYSIGQTLYTEYPDPTRLRGEPVRFCAGVPADGLLGSVAELAGVQLTEEASAMAFRVVVTGLSELVAEAARQHGWKAVGDIVNAPELRGRGWCAETYPSESGAPSRWFRKVDESVRVQGDTRGAMHPTWELHEWIGEKRLREHLQPGRAVSRARADDFTFDAAAGRLAALLLLEAAHEARARSAGLEQ